MELYPNAELPFLIVNISGQLEVDPSYMENQAVIPLEGAIGTLEGIEEIESYAEQRRGLIFIYYTQSTNIKHAYLRLQEKVDMIRPSLPEEFSVNVLKVDTEQMANQFTSFMDKIEKQALPFPSDEKFVRPQDLFPRTATVELIETIDFHRAISESVGIGIIVIDTDTKIISINSLGLEILQQSFEKLLNRPITTIFSKKVKEKLIETLKGVLPMKEAKKISFFAPIHSKKIRVIVSVLNIKCEMAGCRGFLRKFGRFLLNL